METQGQVRNVSTFQHPIQAQLNGRNVRILAVGDQEGKSPVYLSVDENGTSKWESVNQFQITDTNVLPTQPPSVRQTTGSGAR